MSTSEILMNCLAGLGLLFVGIKMVTSNLAAMVGDQLRRAIARASARTGMAMLFGSVAGFVAQSGRTTAFIMASFVHAGLIDSRRALPIVLWSNFGCTLVIFAAIFPLQLFSLFLLAVAGASMAFERPKPLVNAATATFGLALMLFGLKMTSSSAVLLTDLHGFSLVLAFIGKSLLWAFVAGLVLTFIAQSHMSIMLIAVALATRGIFTLDQTLMVIAGTHAGSSLITTITGIHFRGVPRQIVIGQILYNFAAILLFLIAFAVIHLLPDGIDLVQSLPGLSELTAGDQAALAAVLLNFAAPLILTLLLAPYHRLCTGLAPPQADEELERPQFLRNEVSENPVATLMLAEQEQLRLLRRLPSYCDWLRDETPANGLVDRYFQAFGRVGGFIERSQGGLMAQRMTADDTEWLLNQQKRQQMLNTLNETCHELYLVASDVGSAIQPLRVSIVEALDTLLLTAVDAMAKQDVDELALIDTMTRNNGTAMERVRKRYLALADDLPEDQRTHILQITSLFERAAWSVRGFAQLLRDAPGVANGTE
jgi:phosphate:Na+ symporter